MESCVLFFGIYLEMDKRNAGTHEIKTQYNQCKYENYHDFKKEKQKITKKDSKIIEIEQNKKPNFSCDK